MQMVEMKIKIYGLLSVQKEGEEDGKISDESKGEDGEWMDGGDGGATSNLGLWYGGHSFQCKSYLCMCY